MQKTTRKNSPIKQRLRWIQVKKLWGQNKTGIHGFTLVELMVVVSVLGLLAMLSLTIYHSYQKKAKTVEAKVALQELATLQTEFHGINDTYTSDLIALGFSITGLQRYVFTVNSATASSFTASAEANLDGDAALDVWTINEQRTLSHQSFD